MGLLTAAGTLPALLFSLLAGAASDRYGRRRRTMVLADLLRAALWIATVGALAGVLFMLPSPVRRLRRLPDAPEEQPTGGPLRAEAPT